MAKSNRRRKLDRAKRQVKQAQQLTAARRREEWRDGLEAAVGRLKQLSDPDTPPADMAELLNRSYGGDPITVTAVRQMQNFGWSKERLAEVADAMLARSAAPDPAGGGGEPSLTALTFAALVARDAGDVARARALLERALAASVTSDSRVRWNVISHVGRSGRLADAITMMEARLRDDPDDERGVELYGLALSEACAHANTGQPEDACSCGSGVAWAECCGPRERAALSRFTDRSGLTALTKAVSVFLAGSDYGSAVDDEATSYLEDFDDLDLEPDELAEFRALLTEHALLTAKAGGADADQEAEDEEDDNYVAGSLGAFAADPSTPAELAARASAWRRHLRYGLWQVESGPAAPGLWCTDICTGTVVYADFRPHFTDGWPSWSVWLGGLVPVDGVWRATGTGLRLSPAEADAAGELIESAVTSVVHSLAGKKRPAGRPDETLRIGLAEPVGVYVEQQSPQSPYLASITGMVVGYLLSRVVGEVHWHRQAPPEPADEGWEKSWPDEPLPVLGGRTPRQAAEAGERPRLEALLRQFEYEADVRVASGQAGIDTGWLRRELDLNPDSPDE